MRIDAPTAPAPAKAAEAFHQRTAAVLDFFDSCSTAGAWLGLFFEPLACEVVELVEFGRIFLEGLAGLEWATQYVVDFFFGENFSAPRTPWQFLLATGFLLLDPLDKARTTALMGTLG